MLREGGEASRPRLDRRSQCAECEPAIDAAGALELSRSPQDFVRHSDSNGRRRDMPWRRPLTTRPPKRGRRSISIAAGGDADRSRSRPYAVVQSSIGKFWMGVDTDKAMGFTIGTSATQLQWPLASWPDGISWAGRRDLDCQGVREVVNEVLGPPVVSHDRSVAPNTVGRRHCDVAAARDMNANRHTRVSYQA
jgi:hypothetical protein